MGEEVDRQCLMREDLELELQALRPRMLTIQNATGSLETDSLNVGEEDEDQIPRYEEEREIQILEKEILDQAEKIKQYEEYISELVLHAEAQTSQYHQKYTALEAMIHEAKAEPSSNPSISTVNKTEKTSTRIRGSGSPFKCIAGLVQQMNSEKDQELSLARLRIDELEALAASRQKEVCMLSARLAAAESMTHDVIRDLLGVKLDMTNYANLIDQQQVQKLAEKAQQFSEESHAKELEILKLREQINDFIDERESLIGEINQRQTDTLAAQVAVEQLQQRDQMLAAQNGMLKMDKENLKRKVVELDEMVKKLSRSRNFQQRIHQDTKIREGTSSRSRNDEIMKRLAHSAKLLSRVNEVHSRFHKCDGGDPDLDSDEEQG